MATTDTPDARFRNVDGVRIRYADSGGSRAPTIVLTSPWPDSVYAFTPMRASLSEHARLFAVDLPGFGASERRDDLMSPRAMASSWSSSSPRPVSARRTASVRLLRGAQYRSASNGGGRVAERRQLAPGLPASPGGLLAGGHSGPHEVHVILTRDGYDG